MKAYQTTRARRSAPPVATISAGQHPRAPGGCHDAFPAIVSRQPGRRPLRLRLPRAGAVRMAHPRGAAGVALRRRRRQRHLAAHHGRTARPQSRPAVHRREQAGRRHQARQRIRRPCGAGRLHRAVCGGALCHRRGAVWQAELRAQGIAAGGDGGAGAAVFDHQCGGSVQDAAGADRLRQVAPRGPDFRLAGRRFAAASGRRAAVQGRRGQGPQRAVPRRFRWPIPSYWPAASMRR